MNRIPPKMPAHCYKTYVIGRPLKPAFWRKATCEEVDCKNWRNGWKSIFDLSTPLGQKQARYVRDHSGRSYVVEGQVGTLVTLVFAAGQTCFNEHKTAIERDPLFVIREGDFRGNPREIAPLRLSPIAWRDNFGEHQETLAEAARRG